MMEGSNFLQHVRSFTSTPLRRNHMYDDPENWEHPHLIYEEPWSQSAPPQENDWRKRIQTWAEQGGVLRIVIGGTVAFVDGLMYYAERTIASTSLAVIIGWWTVSYREEIGRSGTLGLLAIAVFFFTPILASVVNFFFGTFDQWLHGNWTELQIDDQNAVMNDIIMPLQFGSFMIYGLIAAVILLSVFR